MSMSFVTFTYKIPSEPSKNRVYIWRSIKELGAIYLQQGVAVLPYDEELCNILQKLRQQVNSFGGKSTLSKLDFLNEEDERETILEFKNQIDEEFNEFIENCQRLIYELDRETENGKFKFSEIQENEEELKKFQRWLDKISKRNYFKSENEKEANNMFEKAKIRLQEYSNEVCKRDEGK